MPLHSAPLAVNDGGGGGAAFAGLLSAGSGLPGSRRLADFWGATQPETGCPADPGGPSGAPTGKASHSTGGSPVAYAF